MRFFFCYFSFWRKVRIIEILRGALATAKSYQTEMVNKKKSRISSPFIIFTFVDIRVIFLIPTLMIIIQYMFNYVNGKSYNIQQLTLYIFVVFAFVYLYLREYSYCSGKQTFNVSKIYPIRQILYLSSGVGIIYSSFFLG